MGLVQNLKKTLSSWGDRILVELSCHYIKHLAKQTLKKPDNSSSTESSLSPLTLVSQDTTIATSSADTSEKITMKETGEIVNYVREWAKDLVDSYDQKSVDRIGDKFAIIDEYHEWFDLNQKELEIMTLDEITEEEYNNYLERN